MFSENLIDALAVTAELCGTNLSDPAKRMMLQDLSNYPEHLVIGALTACRKQLKGRLTISEIISRIDDGRPGVEAAWAMIPRDEKTTVIWTEEMSQALGVASPLLDQGEDIAARMAFKEAYLDAVVKARDECRPVKWSVSLGHDKDGRKPVIDDAVSRGLIDSDHAKLYLPMDTPTAEKVLMLGCENGTLPREKALEMIAKIRSKFTGMLD